MPGIRVLIVGSGLGGLTLAQSLRRAGIDVAVFERDSGPFDRPQGYRLHLDADALNATHEVLTDELRQVFDATAYRTEPYTTILGTDLSVIRRLPTGDEHDTEVWPGLDAPGHANVDRATLREILLAGLDDVVHFGKTFDRYESTPVGVVAYFTDGSTATGDVLVGADGIRSAVRRQRAPQCDTVDAGITAIYGRIPLDKARDLVPEETLRDIFTIAADDRKVFLGSGAVEFPMTPSDAADSFASGMAMRAQSSYVVCIVGGRHEYFPSRDQLRRADGARLQAVALKVLGQWPAPARGLIEGADPETFFLVEMYTSVPCAMDAPTNVTVLGDAIHAMTPTLGRGANLAMRDGVQLGRALRTVAEDSTSIAAALGDYEHHLLGHGFAVVREAAEIGRQRMNQNPLPTDG